MTLVYVNCLVDVMMSQLPFDEGIFSTVYLAPKDYHRIHMPITGKLEQMIFIPGDLFSVNPLTAENVPNLFARNERAVAIFSTAIGPMAMVLSWRNHCRQV